MSGNVISNVSIHPWSDSWLLYSIVNATRNGPADLAKIIAVGDHYNHAVFTSDELYGGLDRLTENNWILSQNNFVSPSTQAIDMYESIREAKVSCYEEMKLVEKALNSKV